MSSRKDGKQIANCLQKEANARVDPAHGNVLSVLCDWLDDGNTTRAVNGLKAAIKYEDIQILEGTLHRPRAIGFYVAQNSSGDYTEDDVVAALKQLRRDGHEELKVEDYLHLASLIGLPDVDPETLRSTINGMERYEVLVLCQNVWPWELMYLDTPEAA